MTSGQTVNRRVMDLSKEQAFVGAEFTNLEVLRLLQNPRLVDFPRLFQFIRRGIPA